MLAAYDALRLAGVRTPLGTEEIGVALGVEEGIDGIKAQYYREILKDGPLGASPIVFPLTTPNTVAARISIALDLRGENVTMCGGTLSGAHALGRAMEALREPGGRRPCSPAVRRPWSGSSSTRSPSSAGPRVGRRAAAACLFLLRAPGSADAGSVAGQILGYSEAVGAHDVREAVEACLQDAALAPSQVRSVRVASALDPRVLVESVCGVGVDAPVRRSPSAWLAFRLVPSGRCGGHRTGSGRTAGADAGGGIGLPGGGRGCRRARGRMMTFHPDIYQLPASDIARIQDTLLRETIERAARTSPFYRERFSGGGPDPAAIRSRADLTRLPFTSKEDIQERTQDFWAAPREALTELVATTGTTGEPIYVAMTDRDLERLGENERRGFTWLGAKPGDRFHVAITLDNLFVAGLAYHLGLHRVGASGDACRCATGPAPSRPHETVAARRDCGRPLVAARPGQPGAQRRR